MAACRADTSAAAKAPSDASGPAGGLVGGCRVSRVLCCCWWWCCLDRAALRSWKSAEGLASIAATSDSSSTRDSGGSCRLKEHHPGSTPTPYNQGGCVSEQDESAGTKDATFSIYCCQVTIYKGRCHTHLRAVPKYECHPLPLAIEVDVADLRSSSWHGFKITLATPFVGCPCAHLLIQSLHATSVCIIDAC